MNDDDCHRLDFELSNVGRGSDTVQPANLAAESESLLVVLLGSHYCSRSRALVRTLAREHEAFRGRDTTVVPVLPDIRERARLWDRQYDLPFPMLADPATDGDETDAFGAFGPLQDAVATRPAFALCRADEGGVTVVATATEPAIDVPPVESLLAFLDRHRESEAAARSGTAPADG